MKGIYLDGEDCDMREFWKWKLATGCTFLSQEDIDYAKLINYTVYRHMKYPNLYYVVPPNSEVEPDTYWTEL